MKVIFNNKLWLILLFGVSILLSEKTSAQTFASQVDISFTPCNPAISLNNQTPKMGPNPTNPIELQGCSNSAPFDLTQVESLLTSSYQNYRITYYASENHANNATQSYNPYNPTNFTSGGNGNFMHVRVEDVKSSCYTQGVFKLVAPSTGVALPTASAGNPYGVEACDIGNDNTESFNLANGTTRVLDANNAGNPTLLKFNPAFFEVVFFTTDPGANTNFNPTNKITTSINSYSTGTATIYARIEHKTFKSNSDCISSSAPYELTLREQPSLKNNPYSITACDSAPTGSENFDLTVISTTANGVKASFTSEYYSDVALTSQIAAPTTYSSTNNSKAYIKVLNGTCFDSSNIDLTLTTNKRPTLPTFNDFILCDMGTGSAGFRLSDYDTNVLSRLSIYSNTTFSYLDASNNSINAQNSHKATNEIITIEAVDITLQNGTACSSRAPLKLKAIPQPNLTAGTYTLCDTNRNGSEDFDLAAYRATNLTTVNTTYTFHVNQSDADSGANVIPPNTAYPSATKTIYIRAKSNTLNSCYDTAPLKLVVAPRPSLASIPGDIKLCDTNRNGSEDFDLAAYRATNLTTVNTTYTFHVNQSDADSGANAIPPNTAYPSATKTIYIRAKSNTLNSCYDTAPLKLVVAPRPSLASIPGDIKLCDTNRNGSEDFDLAAYRATNLTTVNTTYTFHVNQSDADSGANAIPPNTAYPSATKTIYIRAKSNTLNSCYDTAPLKLVVAPRPSLAGIPGDIKLCDTNRNGSEDFDLAAYRATNLTTVNTTYTFHVNQSDADSGANVIPPNTTYPSATKTIYIRAKSNTLNSCYDTAPLKLVVAPRPSLAGIPRDIKLCDTNRNGSEDFDLAAYRATNLTTVNTTYTFHVNQSDADSGANAIPPNTAYPSATKTIYIRAESGTLSTCYETVALNLVVVARPSLAGIPGDIKLCDTNRNGSEDFDLAAYRATNLTTVNTTYTFHVNQSDADSGANAIPPNTAYPSATKTIYIRAESGTLSTCYETVALNLVVVARPSLAGIPGDIKLCDTNRNGSEDFDLAAYRATNLTTVNTTYTFHVNQSDADSGANAIPPNTAYPSATKTIYIRAKSNTLNSCYDTAPLKLVVAPRPSLAGIPGDIKLCDTNRNGSEDFDLAAYRATNLTTVNTTYTFHVSQSDADSGANAIPPNTTYPSATKTIYIRAKSNTLNSCYDTAPLNLKLFRKPLLGNLAEMIFCVTRGNATGNFDLNAYATTNFTDPNSYSFHETQADANGNVNPLASPYTTVTKTIFVRAESKFISTCYDIATLSLKIIHSPSLQNLPDIVLCDIGRNRTEGFDLDKYQRFSLPTIQRVTYHFYRTNADAMSDANRIPLNTLYMSSGSEIIYVRTDVMGGLNCINMGQFNLILNQLPQVNSNPKNYEQCTNQRLPFNLRTMDTEVYGSSTIATNVSITYYESQNDADTNKNGVNAKNYLFSGGNSKNIFARIENNISNCYVTTSFNVKYYSLPILNINKRELCDDDYDGLINFNLGTISNNIKNDIRNQGFNVSVSMHNTNKNIGQLPTVYKNTNPNTQTIYYRVVDLVTSCVLVTPLELVVNPLPRLSPTTPKSVVLCEDDIVDGIVDLRLDHYYSILTTFKGATINFYYTRTDATNNTNKIISNTIRNRMPYNQTLYYKVITAKRCSSPNVGQFDITIRKPILNANNFSLKYTECDDGTGNDKYDRITNFDISDFPSKVEARVQKGNYNYTYHKTFKDASLITNNVTNIKNYRNTDSPGTQVLYARIEDTQLNCILVDKFINLNVITIPPFKLTSPYGYFCKNNVDLVKIGVDLGTGYTYRWNTGDSTVFLTIPNEGEYFVDVIYKSNCTKRSNTLSFGVSEAPEISKISKTGNLDVYPNRVEVKLNNDLNYGDFKFQLDEFAYQEKNVFENVFRGNHLISVKDSNGCGIASLGFTILNYPRYFTPNGDGFNDTWSLGFLGKNLISAKIFDRYGVLIKELTTGDTEWDGNSRGKRVPSEDYWVEIEYIDITSNQVKISTGNFTLKR